MSYCVSRTPLRMRLTVCVCVCVCVCVSRVMLRETGRYLDLEWNPGPTKYEATVLPSPVGDYKIHIGKCAVK